MAVSLQLVTLTWKKDKLSPQTVFVNKTSLSCKPIQLFKFIFAREQKTKTLSFWFFNAFLQIDNLCEHWDIAHGGFKPISNIVCLVAILKECQNKLVISVEKEMSGISVVDFEFYINQLIWTVGLNFLFGYTVHCFK